MPINLTTPVAITNGTRLVIADVNPNDAAQSMSITYELRTAPATDLLISTATIVIRNSTSDRVLRGAPPVGAGVQAFLRTELNAVATPTGYTDAINAWRGQATAAARRNALDALGLSAGWVDSSLTGT